MIFHLLQRMEQRQERHQAQHQANDERHQERCRQLDERRRAVRLEHERFLQELEQSSQSPGAHLVLHQSVELERSFPETSEAISTWQEEEELRRQYSEDLPHPVVSSAGRSIAKLRWPRRKKHISITKTEVPRCTVEEPVRMISDSATSPVTARRAIFSSEQERRGAPPNIVSSICRCWMSRLRKGWRRMALWRDDPVRSRNRPECDRTRRVREQGTGEGRIG